MHCKPVSSRYYRCNLNIEKVEVKNDDTIGLAIGLQGYLISQRMSSVRF